MRVLHLSLGLGLGLCGGCVGMDDTLVEAPHHAPADDFEPTEAPAEGPSWVADDDVEPATPGPSVRLLHGHAVDPAPDLAAARRTVAGLDPDDPQRVLWQHRIAIAVMLQSDGLPPEGRWDATLREFEAAATIPSSKAYANVDELLLDYAAIAFEAGDTKRGQAQLLRLIREHPMSALVPHAYATFADHMFDTGQVQDAAKLYGKLTAFGEPILMAYSAYRTGWCHLRDEAGNEVRALEMFVRAIDVAQQIDGPWARRLAETALDDATLAYVEVGRPAKARVFFERVVKGTDVDVDRPLHRLAQAYADRGDDDAVALVCRDLAEPCG